ncbi:MAG: serine hydrolase [Actinomycetota bacterium]
MVLLETGGVARWSVCVRTVDGHDTVLSVAPDRVLKTASVAKLVLLVEVASRISDGSLDGNEPLRRESTAPVHDSGLWQRLRTGVLTIHDAAVLVAAVSDNWATNALLRRVGLDAVQARGRALGLRRTRLLDEVRDVRGQGDAPTLSVGSAAEWVSLLCRLARREVGSRAVSEQVLDWMRASVDLSMVASALGLDPLSHWTRDRGVVLCNKTGTDVGVRADVGIVSGRVELAYACVATWDESARPELRPAVLRDMRRLGELVASRVL